MQPALRITDPAPTDRRAELAADGVLSVADAQAFLSLGRTEVYGLMDRGKLPFIKLGRRRVIPKRALVELLAANMVGGQS